MTLVVMFSPNSQKQYICMFTSSIRTFYDANINSCIFHLPEIPTAMAYYSNSTTLGKDLTVSRHDLHNSDLHIIIFSNFS